MGAPMAMLGPQGPYFADYAMGGSLDDIRHNIAAMAIRDQNDRQAKQADLINDPPARFLQPRDAFVVVLRDHNKRAEKRRKRQCSTCFTLVTVSGGCNCF